MLYNLRIYSLDEEICGGWFTDVRACGIILLISKKYKGGI
jgi:hypothetical protein